MAELDTNFLNPVVLYHISPAVFFEDLTNLKIFFLSQFNDVISISQLNKCNFVLIDDLDHFIYLLFIIVQKNMNL